MTRAATPEFALVAACCRWPASPVRIAAVQAAAQGIDWDAFLRTAARHRVTALVRHGLRDAGIAPPPAIDRALGDTAAAAARAALAMAHETLRLQGAFDAAAIPVLFVKGSPLALLAYGELGIKQSWDIDLLVMPEQLLPARHLLESLGYVLILPEADDAGFARFARVAKEAVFHHPARGVHVELHWRLIDNHRMLPGIDSRSPGQAVVLGGRAIRTLQPEPLFAYLCLHGTRHGWFRLKWIADVAALLARGDPAETGRLHRAAITLRAGRASAVALLLCHDVLGLALPPDLARALRGDRRTRMLLATARACLAEEKAEFGPYSPAGLRMLASHFLIGGRADAWSELRQKWRSADDRALLALPRALDFGFDLLRLPLLVSRRIRLAWRKP